MHFMIFGMEILPWHFFASTGMILMALEMIIPGFILLPIGLAFMITALASVFITSLTSQLAFLGGSLVVVFYVMHKWIKSKPRKRLATNVHGMVGKKVTVINPISRDTSGYVKLYGDQWQAFTDSEQSFSVGERVEVTKVIGNKVYIKNMEK